ncbi:Polypeptide N-acetylgalactosaminyltransferase [Fasciola hepatica]|uniref:Polypeptide N-acetylgalactosaminyltransferase n=1 Tax=Fasciola hepatica TaxID=6192 RepID=A0A4E0S0R0_FASHE|nr:Polypeptide N-acetylgalactosaminyltransferase [Fasciola hepatica]
MKFRIGRVIKLLTCLLFCFVIVYLVLTPKYHMSDTQTSTIVDTDESIWEDENLNAKETKRIGPGEQGKSVQMTQEERKMEHYYYIPNGFNKLVSDKIALDRSLPDIRHEKCKSMKYLRNLPTVSVIIPFFEEHWSVLLRTFISIVIRSPKQLLKEVILVDDGSTGRPELKGQLDDYLESNYPNGLVRVIRSATHEGLIRARLIGARQAIGDVLVFLDSHCEVTRNWLPPLLDPIVRDYRTVTCPIIDAIDAGSFGYSARSGGPRGAFTWEMYYVRLPKLPKDELFPEKPFDDLIMAGGLLAVSRKWFWEMGAYDPELEVWGGEQFEISFKVWMCGGRLLDVPCSRVGHVFRIKGPFFNGTVPKGNYVARNYKPHRTVMIKHVPTTNCLESEIKTKSVFVNPCEMRNTGQQWIWESIDISRFNKTVKSPTP